MPDWNSDLRAMWKGWNVIIKGQLYYDARTKQYYDDGGKQLTYGQVRSQFNIDPMQPTPMEQAPPSLKTWEGSFAGGRPEAYARPYAADRPEAQPEWMAGHKDLWAEAQAISERTGRPVEDIFASLTMTPLPEDEEVAGMSEYQREQLALQKGQFQWQQQQAQQQQQTQRYGDISNFAQMRMQAYGGGGQGGPPGQMSMEDIWKAVRREILGQMGPRDWIRKWQIGQKENPYIRDDMTPVQRVRKWATELEKSKAMLDRAKEWKKDFMEDDSFDIPQGVKDYHERAAMEFRNAWTQFEKAEKEYAREGSRWSQSIQEDPSGFTVSRSGGRWEPKPKTPETPDWLRKIYPELGERLPEKGKATKVATPSPQMWSSLTPTQREKWGGYASYTGAKPVELLEQMEQMKPRSPFGRRARYTPMEQMA